MATTLPLVRGTLDLLVLRALRWEPTHGAGVATWIRYVTAGAIEVDEGSLYPALHRLEERGLITSEWGRSEHNRRARTYQVTAEGRDFFWEEQERWERYKEVVDRVLRYGTAGGILGR
jgi:PadR family transcriptional regulator, regulatory protein PadR